uniref:Uncharacterized protein n=1 Tax=Cacopsylla melanoneura TaxID=428564 RepID=A0A8D9BQ80_9HEMI
MSNRDSVYWVVPQSVLLVWLLISPLDGAPVQETQDRKKEKAIEKMVDWDYAGLHLEDHVPLQDKLNYHELCMLRRERQLRDPKQKLSQSREQYENHEFKRLYNAVFSTKPPHLRTSEENYIQFLKDDFFRKQLDPQNPQTSRERYEWHLKKSQGSFFGGKYDFETYLAGNFTARRRRSVDAEDVPNKAAKQSNHAKRRRRRAAARRAKIVYPTQKVVDYLNERAFKEHDEMIGARNRDRFKLDSKECKARAYYTSNESKKKPIYQYNERAIQEKEIEKAIDYQNYNADIDYQMKCKAYYFKDGAKYKNKPKTLSEKMGHKEGPKYKFKRMKRHAAKETPKYTTWAVVHYSKPYSVYSRPNLTLELDKMIKAGIDNMKYRQEALEAPGHWPDAHLLEENRTTFRLPTYRNFVDEVKTFVPYTFPTNAMDQQLYDIDSNIWIPSEEFTTPRGSYNDWINAQLKEFRKKYKGLTVQDPFAHYPEYTWENIGFDLKKMNDPFPPIWPEKHVQFNADVMKEHFAASVPTEAPFIPDEWDSKGREVKTVYRPPTRKVILPNNI